MTEEEVSESWDVSNGSVWSDGC